MSKFYKLLSKLGDIGSLSSTTIGQGTVLSQATDNNELNKLIDFQTKNITDFKIIENNLNILDHLSSNNSMLVISVLNNNNLDKNTFKNIEIATKNQFKDQIKKYNISELNFENNYNDIKNGNLKIEEILKKAKHQISDKIDLSSYFAPTNVDTSFRAFLSPESIEFELNYGTSNDNYNYNNNNVSENLDSDSNSNQNISEQDSKNVEKILTIVDFSDKFDKYSYDINAFFIAQVVMNTAKAALLASLIVASFWAWNLAYDVGILGADLIYTSWNTYQMEQVKKSVTRANNDLKREISNHKINDAVKYIQDNKFLENANTNLSGIGLGIALTKLLNVKSLQYLVRLIPIKNVVTKTTGSIKKIINSIVKPVSIKAVKLMEEYSLWMSKSISVIQSILTIADTTLNIATLIHASQFRDYVYSVEKELNS